LRLAVRRVQDALMSEVNEGAVKDPKSRSMPLTAAMARFVDVAELVKSRTITDEVLRELCEDYRLARETLTKLRKAKPKRAVEIEEYMTLVAELEDEIVRRLLGSGEPSDG
jgi:benzoyl-CoA reductase/2-hydroxyglutaryl-CoA dehydratase subunit BcrC/BadD/HgdB